MALIAKLHEMPKFMKRLFSSLLSLVLVATLFLAGCSLGPATLLSGTIVKIP